MDVLSPYNEKGSLHFIVKRYNFLPFESKITLFDKRALRGLTVSAILGRVEPAKLPAGCNYFSGARFPTLDASRKGHNFSW